MDFDPPDIGPDDPTNPYRYGFGDEDLSLTQLWVWLAIRVMWMMSGWYAFPYILHEIQSFLPAVIPGAWPSP